MVNLINRIETLHNAASDSNFVWFPFSFLKPKAAQAITCKRLLKMTLCFGLYFNFAYILKKIIMGESIEVSSLVNSQLAFLAAFFLWFNLVTKYFWNRRAKRLSLVDGEKHEF